MTNDFTMPVAPINNGGFGGGDSGAWWLLILLFALGGWGGGFGGYGNGGGFVGADVQRGFDQSAIMSSLNGLSNSLTSGFASAELAESQRTIADLQAGYANTNAIVGQLNAMQMAQQNCCCENRAAIADLKYTIANEGCQDRAAVAQNTQLILDKMCSQEIDNLKSEVLSLQNQVNMKNLEAQTTAQTAAIIADNARQTALLEAFLAPAA